MRTKPDKPLRSPLRTLTSSPPPRNTHALRKITSQAENRMLTRTAKSNWPKPWQTPTAGQPKPCPMPMTKPPTAPGC